VWGGPRCYPGAIEGNSIKHEPQGRESAALGVCCLTFLFLFFPKTTRKGGTIHARKRRHDRGQQSTLG
jgi:hypothetical protein